MDLKPFACPGCGGALPLGSGSEVSCPQCNRSVPLPQSYCDLRSAHQARQGAREQAQALYERLGRPPGALLTAAAGLAALWLMGILLVLGGGFLFGVVVVLGTFVRDLSIGITEAVTASIAIAVMMLPVYISYLLHGLASTLGTDWADVLAGGRAQALFGVAVWGVMIVPTVLFELADQFTDLRQKLRAMLAARPPASPGGASLCRQCGAALELSEGQLGVECAYCQADNLLQIPAELISVTKLDANDFRSGVSEADLLERSQRAQGRAWALRALAGGAAVIPVMWLLGMASEALVDGSPRPGVYRSDAGIVGPNAHTYRLGESITTRGGHYFVALQRGQELSLEQSHGPLHIVFEKRKVGRWFAPEWKWQSDNQEPFVAAYSGWYRVTVKNRNPQNASTFQLKERGAGSSRPHHDTP